MNDTTPTPKPQEPGPLLRWYENRRPAVRALILMGATTAINLFAPWLAPFLRPTAPVAEPPAVVAPAPAPVPAPVGPAA